MKRGGENIAKKIQVNLAEIAAQSNVSETLSTRSLIGKMFTLNNVKRVTGMYGDSFVGDLTLDGKNVEAWLSGARVIRQIEALLEADNLPREKVTIIVDKEAYGEPFELADA